MNNKSWITTNHKLPDIGVIVETKIHDEQGERNVCLLKYQHNLWFLKDGSMYVYYRPTHWRHIG